MALAITLGAGRRNARGKATTLPADVPPARAIADVLSQQPRGVESWWSQHTWAEGHRTQDRWRAASAVVIDLDYHDDAGGHVAAPMDARAAIHGAAISGRLPGSLFHHTPRGARVVFAFADQVTDADVFAACARSAGALVTAALRRAQIPGYTVDAKILTDLARMMFGPNAKVDGQQREAEVIVMRDAPYTHADLSPPEAPRLAPALTFDDAVARWNADYAREYPRSDGDCPACGHRECFGTLPDSGGARWACFSTSHTGAGIQGPNCWHGDALDLDAHAAGLSRADLLRREGYLARVVPLPAGPSSSGAPVGSAATAPGKSYGSLVHILRTDRRVVEEPLEFNEMLHTPTVGTVPIEEASIGQYREKIELLVKDAKGRGLSFSSADITQALLQVAAERKYHPVRDYLEALRWDGVERIASVVEDVLDAKATELTQALVRKWFIQAVARVMKPGCQAHGVLILLGAQGAGKSTFFRTLAGEEWFSDSPVDLANKDAMMLLRRVWFLEWAELGAMQNAKSVDSVKAFITSATDTFRPPYGKGMVTAPRHCVIVGTTNDEEILSDPTGNRRYWIVRAGSKVDTEKLAEWRDHLWAEALVAFRKGEPWHLTDDEHATLRTVQAEFERGDPWTAPVLAWARCRREPFTLGEVLEGPVDKARAHITRTDEMRVASILRRGGWNKTRIQTETGRAWRWWKADDEKGGES